MSDDSEVRAAQDIPAVFANRFQITVSSDFTRIAFGEAIVGTDATYRLAIAIRNSDAIELAATLTRLIALQASSQKDDGGPAPTGTMSVSGSNG